MTEKEQNDLKEKINKIDEQISVLSALRKKYTDELNTLPDYESFKVSEIPSSKELSPDKKIQLSPKVAKTLGYAGFNSFLAVNSILQNSKA